MGRGGGRRTTPLATPAAARSAVPADLRVRRSDVANAAKSAGDADLLSAYRETSERIEVLEQFEAELATQSRIASDIASEMRARYDQRRGEEERTIVGSLRATGKGSTTVIAGTATLLDVLEGRVPVPDDLPLTDLVLFTASRRYVRLDDARGGPANHPWSKEIRMTDLDDIRTVGDLREVWADPDRGFVVTDSGYMAGGWCRVMTERGRIQTRTWRLNAQGKRESDLRKAYLLEGIHFLRQQAAEAVLRHQSGSCLHA